LKSPVQIDVIILSYAKDAQLKALTEQTIATLLHSEDPEKVRFNILVIESNKSLSPFQFANTSTLYPETDFGFNKFLNLGIKATSNPYVCLCNNDLIFHRNWASEILKVMDNYPEIQSANPFCDAFSYSFPVNRDQAFVRGKPANLFKGALTGWCIFAKRKMFALTGMLDENFSFWYADRDYGKTLLQYNVKHALVVNAVVTHLGNRSHQTLSDEQLERLTYGQLEIYEKKWGKDHVLIKEKMTRALLLTRRWLLALIR
jgi:GT2 family glycosyltransferase